MVLSSNQEGGANVVSEAIAADVPIIASNIPGNTGLLVANILGCTQCVMRKHSLLLQKQRLILNFNATEPKLAKN